MEKYHKINSVYKRDMENNPSKLIDGDWVNHTIQMLQDITWICTEKIDGTNIRVIWDGDNIEFRGKTDKAIIPDHLLNKLTNMFSYEKMKEQFGDKEVCLYGEGYGFKIHKGHDYIKKDVSFILFDIKVGKWWLEYEDIVDIAYDLGIDTVPVIHIGGLNEAIEIVKEGFKSKIAQNEDYDAEGLVCKPIITLFDRAGNRIVTKVKTRDFR